MAASSPEAPREEEGARPSPSTNFCKPGDEKWVLAATILGSSMVFIDGTVISVALPVLQQELGATVVDLQWVVEAYTLCLAALILVGGSLGDHLGRRRVFAIGVAVFAGASILCGLSPDIRFLILARAVQGIGGALLAPGSLAIISASFPEDRRGAAIGTWSAFTAITTAGGPVLGGFFVEHLSWRWVFLINVPLAIVTILLAVWRVPESRDEEAPESLDWWGAALATAGLGLVVYGLTEASNLGLQSPVVIGTVVGGIVTLGLFVVAEARQKNPMMPLTVFRSRNFSAANILTFLLYAGLSGGLFLLPFNLIQVQGYSTTAAGAAMLPFVLMIFVLSRWSGGLVAKVGPKLPLVVGPLVFAGATCLYLLTGIGGSYWTTFFPIVLLQGLGMAIAVAPLTTVVMASVPSSHAGVAAGINNAVSRTGGLIAIAVVGVLAVAAFGAQLDRAVSGLGLAPDALQALQAERTRLASMEVPPELAADTAAAVQRAIAEAFVASFHVVQIVCAALALAAGLSALMLGNIPVKPEND
jgi:EmrB/QacA subfamily drug resistance transporter